MALPTADQLTVWGFTPAQLSNDAKWTWQYMADADLSWSSETGATDISAAMGGSLTPAEVDTALTELRDKGLISAETFKVEPPPAGP